MEDYSHLPSLPMEFDVQSDPSRFSAVYRHLGRSRVILNWIRIGVGVIVLALAYFSTPYIQEEHFLRLVFWFGILCVISGAFNIYTIKKRILAVGSSQAKLCGDAIHYKVTEDGILNIAQDGYSYHPFDVLNKVVSYPDMWLLYFGSRQCNQVHFILKTPFPDSDAQNAFESLLKKKLNGKPIIYKSK